MRDEVKLGMVLPDAPQLAVDADSLVPPLVARRIVAEDRQPAGGGALQKDHRIVLCTSLARVEPEVLKERIGAFGPIRRAVDEAAVEQKHGVRASTAPMHGFQLDLHVVDG